MNKIRINISQVLSDIMKKSVWEILRGRYPEESCSLMAEVHDSTGGGRRSLDFMVMSLWKSRGQYLSGIELKSSRSDWLRELKNPNKQEPIFKYCDYFYLLTNGKNVAQLEEIPETWGWMDIKGGRIVIKKKAPKLDPQPMDRKFLAPLLRRASSKDGFIHKSSIQTKINEAKEIGANIHARENGQALKELKDLKEGIAIFEKESGVKFPRYARFGNPSAKHIGQAVKFIQNGGDEGAKKELLRLETIAQNVLNKISAGLEPLR
ncbi:MAG: hypothetical protein COA79_20445 [Planctomycetota bacterium]|nr:MAG: hypothetical protein COA79_20445 [Planctomycetota bacterium]